MTIMDNLRNAEINHQLTVLYRKNCEEFIAAYAEAFHDCDPPCSINEFGIIDEARYCNAPFVDALTDDRAI